MSKTGMYNVINSNKRKSLLLLFCMAIFMVFIATLFGAYLGGAQNAASYALGFAAIGFSISIIGALVSYYKGPSLIMAVSKAKKVSVEDETQLHNLVEEMCISSGLPKPDIYVIEDASPNAFATGRDPEHSAIALTRGLMDKLNRNELMGVIAHEMSHIQNYDIRFATLMTVMVGTIGLMSNILLRISIFGGGRSRRSNNNNSGNGQMQLVITVLAIVMMILAPICAVIIQLASSRKREYLADASAAKMTRNPEALASALRKISGDGDILASATKGTQQLFIVNPLKGKKSSIKQNLFSTHPPIQERIRCLTEMS